MRRWCLFRLRFVIFLMAVRDIGNFSGLVPMFLRLIPHSQSANFPNSHGVNDRLFVDPNYGLLTFHDGRSSGQELLTPFGYYPVGQVHGVLHPIQYAPKGVYRPNNYWERSSEVPLRPWSRDPRKSGMSSVTNDQAEFKVSFVFLTILHFNINVASCS